MNKDEFRNIDICCRYDGSFYGMLSCIFESFEKREMPIQIKSDDFSMFRMKGIETNEEKAERILNAIPKKIGNEALKYLKLAYLANIEEKEIALIHFLKEGFKCGRKFIQLINTGWCPVKKVVTGALTNKYLEKIQKGVNLLTLDSQRFIQFVRFSEIDGALVSIIEPQNQVLPLISNHFVERYPNEKFLIYDKTHKTGLIYMDGEIRLEHIEEYQMPLLSEKEKDYQKLWKLFYNTVAIEERKNEKCRMNFMPKKYRKNMTEFM
ncbi:MAG: TIGR03915 family putative DNA repair protein [Firmicutes bacterium]|nr:TIGR03915 family putative DNA repair protein [Bacillota bacterium]